MKRVIFTAALALATATTHASDLTDISKIAQGSDLTNETLANLATIIGTSSGVVASKVVYEGLIADGVSNKMAYAKATIAGTCFAMFTGLSVYLFGKKPVPGGSPALEREEKLIKSHLKSIGKKIAQLTTDAKIKQVHQSIFQIAMFDDLNGSAKDLETTLGEVRIPEKFSKEGLTELKERLTDVPGDFERRIQTGLIFPGDQKKQASFEKRYPTVTNYAKSISKNREKLIELIDKKLSDD